MLPKVPFTETQAFKNLKNQAARMKEIHMRSLFQGDSDRFKKFTICFQDILLDYSKNKIDVEVMAALTDLAKECKLDDAIQAMFSGKSINAAKLLEVELHSFTKSYLSPLASTVFFEVIIDNGKSVLAGGSFKIPATFTNT